MAVNGMNTDIGLKKNGYLFIVPPSERNVLKRNFVSQLKLECNVNLLEPEEIKHQYPSMNISDLGAAVHSPDDGWLDPYRVLMSFRHKAISMGVEFFTGEVTGFVWNNTIVTTAKLQSGQHIEASLFINAAGA